MDKNIALCIILSKYSIPLYPPPSPEREGEVSEANKGEGVY
jgi:hypothetical protein